MRPQQERWNFDIIRILIGLGKKPRIAIVEFGFGKFGVIPALNEMPGNITGCCSDNNAGNVVPRHARSGVPVDRVLEGHVQVGEVLHYEVSVVLSNPQLGCTLQLISGDVVIVGRCPRNRLLDEVLVVLVELGRNV